MKMEIIKAPRKLANHAQGPLFNPQHHKKLKALRQTNTCIN
jgi:hypothetical protein